MDRKEIEYAERVESAIKETIKEESEKLSLRRTSILDGREYFSDYFAEFKDDEKRDLLHAEYLETANYENTLGLLSVLTRQSDNPYFAGFDFEEDGADDYEEPRIYLGIHTVRDPETGEFLVYDWRAPMAALYYEKEPGYTSFDAPMGEIKGNLISKRRYIFKKGKLIKISDLKMPSDDETLLEILSSHSQEHMKTIVESIQAEQHRIIRDYSDGCAVIQGCAGSGKSSIALHKTAYVIYAFRKEIMDRKIVILSPNSYFTEYISTVLPDLGENSVICKNPEDIIADTVANALDFDYLSPSESRIYTEQFEGRKLDFLRKEHSFKTTDDFRNLILDYEKYLEENLFCPEDLYYDEDFEKFIPADTVREIFEMFHGNPVFSRPVDMAEYICKEYKLDSSVHNEYLCGAINNMFPTFSVSKIYRNMFIDSDFINISGIADLPAYMPDEILWEDAAAIGVLTVFLYGPMYKTDVFYMIADEAQDFSPIFLELLNKRFKGSNMLFVGDRNQTVFGNSGNYADDIKNIIRKRPFRSYELTTNYRSTKQINGFALKKSGREFDGSKCIREGSEPTELSLIYSFKDKNEVISKAAAYVTDYLLKKYAEGYEKAAVICSSSKLAEAFRYKVDIPYESDMDVKYLPVYLAKGLEFDTVAVINDSEMPFDPSSDYTACTRAMHELLYIDMIKE